MNQNDNTIDLSQLFLVLWNVRARVCGIILTCSSVAFIYALTLPLEYESTALVQTRSAARIDTSGAGAAMAALGLGGGTSPTMSYIELMKTRVVLEPIIDSLDYPEGKKPEAKAFATSRLNLQTVKGTNLISISARGKSPEEAQYISNEVVNNFMIMQTTMNQQTQSLLVQFLDTRITDTKVELDAAEEALSQFSREHKFYDPATQGGAAVEQMAEFDKAIGAAELKAKSAQASLEAANAELAEQKLASKEYRISDNGIVTSLRNRIIAKQLEVVSLGQRYTDEHPSVKQARKELEQLETSLAAEVAATVNSNTVTLNPTQAEMLKSQAVAAVNLSVARASEEALVKQQKKKEEELSGFPDDVMEYSRLKRNVNIKNDVYLNLVKQYEQNKIQEAMDSMDVQVVDSANLPDVDQPVAPRRKLITGMGGVLGSILAIGYGLVLVRRKKL